MGKDNIVYVPFGKGSAQMDTMMYQDFPEKQN